ncbi:MAG: hypothetical protein HYS23_08700 [Geobacter sp.]|nr:hypothetical protein [Geobacter sp.]
MRSVKNCNNQKWAFNFVCRLLFCGFILASLAMLAPRPSFSADLLIESGEYKDKDFVKGVISDYSGMTKGGAIEWLWVDPSVKLAAYKIKIGSFENVSEIKKKSMTEEVRKIFEDTFGEVGSGEKGTLTARCAIYEAERANLNKAWIPFVGLHKAQAGIGVEMEFLNDKGKVVAKFRHSAREGANVEEAAEEVAGDIRKYVEKH